MSKLARQIILTIFYVVLMVIVIFGMQFCAHLVDGETIITNNAGYWTCIALLGMFNITMLLGTIWIWIRKKVPDITVGKRD